MIALFDFVPEYCPNCGERLFPRRDKNTLIDYNEHAAFTCNCGLHFQKARTDELTRAAWTSGGDLKE